MASVSKRTWKSPAGVEKSAWVVRFMECGSNRAATFRTKKEADRFVLSREVSIQRGDYVPRDLTRSVREVAREFSDAMDGRVRNGSLRQVSANLRDSHLKTHIVPRFGAMQVKDVTRNELSDWIGELRSGAYRARRSASGTRGLAQTTTKDVIATFSQMIDFAVRRGYAATNVLADVRRWPEHRHGSAPKVRTFTAEEVSQLLASLETRRKHGKPRPACMMRCMVYLAAFCGLRRGEITGLGWEHLDLEGRVVRVRRSLDQLGELKGPKTSAGVRDVPMPAVVADMLEEWRRLWVDNPRGLVFTTANGVGMAAGQFGTAWRLVLKAADLGPDEEGRTFHFHALRHFAASMMIDHGVSITEVASLMGHRTFDMTLQTYAHPIVRGHHRHGEIEAMSGAIMVGPIGDRITAEALLTPAEKRRARRAMERIPLAVTHAAFS